VRELDNSLFNYEKAKVDVLGMVGSHCRIILVRELENFLFY